MCDNIECAIIAEQLQHTVELLEEVQRFFSAVGIVGMVGSPVWKAQVMRQFSGNDAHKL